MSKVFVGGFSSVYDRCKCGQLSTICQIFLLKKMVAFLLFSFYVLGAMDIIFTSLESEISGIDRLDCRNLWNNYCRVIRSIIKDVKVKDS